MLDCWTISPDSSPLKFSLSGSIWPLRTKSGPIGHELLKPLPNDLAHGWRS